jgi:hypothetical protein
MENPTLTLSDHLLACADLWCAANEQAKLATLGRLAMNDTAFFAREVSRGPTTATLEKFAAFLGDPGQWPGGRVPEKVCEFVHRVEGRTPAGCGSTGKDHGFSRSPGFAHDA